VQGALRANARRIAGIAGAVACVAAIGFVAARAVDLRGQIGPALAQIGLQRFGVGLALYVGASLLLGVNWSVLVRFANGGTLPLSPSFTAHLQSQLAKYLPGNVFHLAYRHMAARTQGVGHAALGTALALESFLLLAVAALFGLGVVADPRVRALVPWAGDVLPWLPAVAGACGVLAVLGYRRWHPRAATTARVAGAFGLVLSIDAVFFLLAALALRALGADGPALAPAAWASWLALAWICGYVTPGAPGGLGLREAVLVLGLGPVLGEATATSLALAYRLVTLASDVLVAAVGFALARYLRRRPARAA